MDPAMVHVGDDFEINGPAVSRGVLGGNLLARFRPPPLAVPPLTRPALASQRRRILTITYQVLEKKHLPARNSSARSCSKTGDFIGLF